MTRRGFALALALVALVVIGALVAGVFFASSQELRIARLGVAEQRAFGAAEHGLQAALASWDADRLTGLAPGATTAEPYVVGPDARAVVRITRTGIATWLLTSDGRADESGLGGARRRTGVVLRLDEPSLPVTAALTARGPVDVHAPASVSGDHTVPEGWTQECPPPYVPVPGIAVAAGVPPRLADPRAVVGFPPVAAGTAIDSADFAPLVSTVSARATMRLDAGAVASPHATARAAGDSLLCLTSDVANWGDPLGGPCAAHHPVVHALGDLRVAGGVGQGMLLVDGDLTIGGDFAFAGVLVVRGVLRTERDAMVRVEGAVIALAGADLAGNTSLRWSSCAAARALRGASRVVVAKERGWTELF